MKYSPAKIIAVLLLTAPISIRCINAQPLYADSLKKAILNAATDSSRIFTLKKISDYYSLLYPDSALYYAEKIIALSKKNHYSYGEVLGNLAKAEALDRIANFPLALEMAYNALDISKTLDTHRQYIFAKVNTLIGHLNAMTGNNKNALPYYHEALYLTTQENQHMEEAYFNYFQLAFAMINIDKPDSALFYLNKGKPFLPVIIKSFRNPTAYLITGNIYNAIGKTDSAEKYYREGLAQSEVYNALFLRAIFYNSIGDILLERKKTDSAIYFKRQSLLLSRKYHYKIFEVEASSSIAAIYDGLNADSTLKYMKIMLDAKDEVFSDSRLRQFQLIGFEDEKREKALQDAKEKYHVQLSIYALVIALVVFLAIGFIFWRNNKHKEKANLLLTQQKAKVEETLSELKLTQAQLIQSEKMASLGQLTAGIAHEIQNPLNFVNNFSDVNKELIAELEQELDKGNIDEVKVIADDIKENETKINHHGKRADAIVKGMLQHSRLSTGQRELTDINALANEYLQLAFHGIRAKDKSFNANLKTEFDQGIGKITIVPQDIGRVLLNLYINAFYAVDEKKKQMTEGYTPTVLVRTKKLSNTIEISIRDNGNGINQAIVDKIFQPFFTTKPTGQGTGLGLSLSYDIVKAHGGDLMVNSTEGAYAEFLVTLPA